MIEIIERDPDTGEPIDDAKKRTIEKPIEAQTVYGGDEGLKLYIKYKIVQLFRWLEDSSVTTKRYFNQYVCFEKKSKRTRKN